VEHGIVPARYMYYIIIREKVSLADGKNEVDGRHRPCKCKCD